MLRNTHLGSGLISLAASLALCVACGGGSDGGGTGGAGGTGGGSTASFSSSLPANEQLGSASAQDSATLCKELEAFEAGTTGAKLTDFSCRLTGIVAAELSGASTDAALQSACKTAYDACVAAPADATTTTCTKPDATCTATVAELEACLNDSGPYIDQIDSGIPTCNTLTQASLSSSTSTATPMTPASCTTYQTKCPDSSLPMPGGT